MALTKRTYALPSKIVGAFEEIVPPGKRSAMVAALLHDWLDGRRRAKLRQDVIEGCREMSDLYLEIEGDYHPLEEEIHGLLESPAKSRGHRSRRT